MQKLPKNDAISYAVMHTMREDELAHSNLAHNLGAKELPPIAKNIMMFTAKVMKRIAWYI